VALRSAIRRLVAVAATAAVALAAAPQGASAEAAVREIAAALRSDPVYVADSQSRLLSIAEQGRIRLRIVRKDIGRIQIAVVSPESAQRAGGIGGLANAIDQAMPGRRGALVATTGSAFHVVTSHGVVEPTAAALRSAVESHRGDGLAAQLLAGVDGIAEVDPGNEADVNAVVPGVPSADQGSPSSDVADDIGESFRIGVLIVAAAIALPFLLGWCSFSPSGVGALPPRTERRSTAAMPEASFWPSARRSGHSTSTSRCRTRARAAATRTSRP
jgi:hypothetical protein